MKEYIVKKHIAIKAPADAVWDALTNPEKTRYALFDEIIIYCYQSGNNLLYL